VSQLDLIVVGSGPAGEKGAVQPAYFGKRVAVIERDPVPGGARITSCALPSKNLSETLGIYTIPELAMVGHTEETATVDGLDVVAGRARGRAGSAGSSILRPGGAS